MLLTGLLYPSRHYNLPCNPPCMQFTPGQAYPFAEVVRAKRRPAGHGGSIADSWLFIIPLDTRWALFSGGAVGKIETADSQRARDFFEGAPFDVEYTAPPKRGPRSWLDP